MVFCLMCRRFVFCFYTEKLKRNNLKLVSVELWERKCLHLALFILIWDIGYEQHLTYRKLYHQSPTETDSKHCCLLK